MVVALDRLYCSSIDRFNQYSSMSIKEAYKGKVYYYAGPPYDIYASAVYPRQSVLPIVKRNGYCRYLANNERFTSVFHRLIESPKYETLAKCGRFDLWEGLSSSFIEEYWPQVKMAIRHGYYPLDCNLWSDMVEMERELGFDIYSPKYVLPEDLQAMHDRMVRRKNEKEREQEVLKHKKDEAAYLKKNKRLVGVCIEEGDITIQPLKNFREFFDEGKAMHHCVALYISKPQSLILSARQNGKRIATIELDTTSFEVVQCKAANNEFPKQYDLLCDLISSYRPTFIKAAKSRD